MGKDFRLLKEREAQNRGFCASFCCTQPLVEL
nr:MAG TPA: hypothetical protein [Caudoviricetes sp.]